MKDRPYKFISKSCDPSMRRAFESFFQTLNGNETKSRPISIVNCMQKTIDPTWVRYATGLNCDARLSNLFKDFLPGKFAKSHGLFKLEDWCINAIREIREKVFAPQIEILPSLDYALTGDFDCAALRVEGNLDQLIETIAELRSIALHCRLIHPKFRPVTKNNKSRNFNIQNCRLLCRICFAPTELMAFANDPSAWVNDEFNDRRPSKSYCREHRPISVNSTAPNSAYQRFLRSRLKIELEISRLQKQSTSWHERRAATGNVYIDEFFRLIALSNHLYPDDEKLIQQLAAKIVYVRINDMKKKIIVALKYGKTQSKIAQLLGTSQQSVSKAISKIPKEFRFDQLT